MLAPLAAAKTTEKDLNQWLVEAEYAVRGEILDRSEELQKQLDAGEKLPFEKIVPCNIGNPQALGQHPISFARQVLSLVLNPELVDAMAGGPAASGGSLADTRRANDLSLISGRRQASTMKSL